MGVAHRMKKRAEIHFEGVFVTYCNTCQVTRMRDTHFIIPQEPQGVSIGCRGCNQVLFRATLSDDAITVRHQYIDQGRGLPETLISVKDLLCNSCFSIVYF
jgi:hypothetical protein